MSEASRSRLLGFDVAGEVFTRDGRVLRGIWKDHAEVYRRILEVYRRQSLLDQGIVGTREAPDDPGRFSLLLEHDAVPFISYPHEWAAPALKDAGLFHVDLFLRLAEYGLTLKDWHLGNILFRSVTPVFVDFTSLIFHEDLAQQSYLLVPTRPVLGGRWDAQARAIFEMYRRMFFPDAHLPLHLMEQGRHALARKRMRESALNAGGGQIARSEVFRQPSPGWVLHVFRDLALRSALNDTDPIKRRFFESLRGQMVRVQPDQRSSDYVDYYAAKNERFDLEPNAAWRDKQRSVHLVLERERPGTVLDIGSNTGWFSLLAARAGAEVVAVDRDEASVGALYHEAQRNGVKVLPLVMDLLDPTPDIAADMQDDERTSEPAVPLLMAAERRLASDMVLALGLLHHLCLGEGLTFDQVLSKLTPFVRKHLVVEFVDRNDELIRSERAFFPAYRRNPNSFGWYTQDGFVAAVGRCFRNVEVLPSHPGARKIIVCEL